MNLKPEEISKVIRSQIKYYSNALEQSEIGTCLLYTSDAADEL